MLKKMLVPLDGSEISEVTFNYARELAERFKGLEVILLHVSPDRDTSGLHRTYIEHSAEKIREAARQGNNAVNVRGELLQFGGRHEERQRRLGFDIPEPFRAARRCFCAGDHQRRLYVGRPIRRRSMGVPVIQYHPDAGGHSGR